MKLLLVGGTSSALGGVERYCQRFADAFRGHPDVSVHSIASETAAVGAPRAAHARRAAAALLRVRRAAAGLDPARDAVWVQYGNAVDLALIAALRPVFRGRLLVTVHAGEQWKHLRPGPARRFAAWALRRPDAVCTLSRAQHRFWAELGIQTTVIPTLLPAWVNDPAPAGERRGGALFVGRVSPEKGIGDLLEAVAALDAGATLDVAGAGDPEYLARLRTRAAALGIADRVRWHGPLPEEGVLGLLRSRAVLAYPSSADAYPLSLLEGFAAGIRVVAYRIPGTAEMLDEFGGTAVAPGDVGALARALEDGLAAPDGAANAGRLRARLAWDVVVERYAELARA